MKVTINYFKESGKWYTADEDVDWPEDETHYTRWKPFREVVRIKNMFAVCLETPLGYPQFSKPQLNAEETLDHIEMLLRHRKLTDR